MDRVTREVLASIVRPTFKRRDAIRAAEARGCEVCVRRLELNHGECPRCDPAGYPDD